MFARAVDRTQAEFFVENARMAHGAGALEALRERLRSEAGRPYGRALKLAITMLERDARRGKRRS